MSRNSRRDFNQLSLNHFSYEALQQADWKQFEQFTVDVLSKYYAPYGLSILRTVKRSREGIGADGSRDGEGTMLFANANTDKFSSLRPAMVQSDLSVLLTLWVEVKQRSDRNVNHHDVGGTIFRSSLDYVTKIVFVSNRGFTRQFSKDLKRFAERNGKQFGLIDGKSLLRIADEVLKTDHAQDNVSSRHQPNTTRAIHAKLSIAVSATLHSFEISPGKVESWLGEPVFIIAECVSDSFAEPIDYLSASLEYDGQEPIRIAPRSGTTQRAVGPGEHFRVVFTIFSAEPVQFSLKSFNLRMRDHEGRLHKIKVTRGQHTCLIRGSILPNWIPSSKTKLFNDFQTVIESWNKSGGNISTDVHAIAGAGKSHFIREMRPTWLAIGAYEVFLDGSRDQRANETALSILSQVFPIPLDEVRSELSATLAEWLSRVSLPEDQAIALANHITSQADDKNLPFNVPQLGRFLALILAKRSQMDPIVLIFEDLHKCYPSTIGLIRALRSTLREIRAGNVLTLFTSREDSIWNDDALRTEWRAAMEEMQISNEVQRLRLTALSNDDALELIRRSIPTIEDHYAEAIIEQVGKTPFGIRESLAFLLESKAVEVSSPSGNLRLIDPDLLQHSIVSQRFRQSTRYRLRGLKERHASSLGDFLDSGACLGNSFDVEACIKNSKPISRRALEKALAECRQLEVIRYSAIVPSVLQFDHDLIRTTLLHDMGPATQRRLAQGLVENLAKNENDGTLASLAYQAGLGNECWNYSIRQANSAAQAKRHMEAVHSLGLALSVTDQNVVAKLFNVRTDRYRPSFDEAIAVAEPCTRENLSRQQREQDTAELLLRYVEHLAAVGSAGSPSIDIALTEAEMLAVRRKDRALRATLMMYHGRQEFSRDNPHGALERHKLAEEMFASLESTPEVQKRRSRNQVRLAIALRQTGQLDESRRQLVRAIKRRRQSDWTLATQVRANFGATFFYIDWTRTRRHWSRAVRIAELRHLPDRLVHSLIDVAHLDLLEDELEAAVEKLEHALSISKEFGLENSELRCLLNLGCEAMMRGDHFHAIDLFRAADRLGYRHGSGRRLWRARANLATAYFLLGDVEKSLTADKITINSMPSLKNRLEFEAAPFYETRLILALANIAIRARISTGHKALLTEIPDSISHSAVEFAAMVLKGESELLPGLRGRHCKNLNGQRFFIITE